MTVRRGLIAFFVLLITAGSLRDVRTAPAARSGVLVADLHVHPFPGDGALTVWQLQREASRRGLDVIAIAGHNNRVALRLAHALGLVSDVPMIIESQELTSPDFHIVAVGVREMIDWRLAVPEAVQAIHAQGGVAIAAHPVPLAWKPMDVESLRALDGVEVAHPMAGRTGSSRRDLDAFFAAARAAKPGVAPIGSTDFHGAAPLGLCRTYLLTTERSAAGALAAIRQGRTVAQDQYGRLYGEVEHVDKVREYLVSRPLRGDVTTADKAVALAALMSLAAAIAWRRISP
jgi:hypothetical protein